MDAVGEITVQETRDQVRANLQRRHLNEKLAFGVLWTTGILVVLVLFFVIFYLLLQGGKFFIGPDFLVDAEVVDDAGEMLEEISETAYTIGYMSFVNLGEGVKPLYINGVEPSVANVTSGDYLLRRELNMVAGPQSRAEVQAWLDFVASAEAQEMVRAAGFAPVADAAPFDAAAYGTLAGEVTVAGPEIMAGPAAQIAEAFMAHFPDVTVNVTEDSATMALRMTGKEEIDVAMSDRAIKDYEFHRYRQLAAYPMAYDGIAVVVNPDIPVEGLSIGKVRDIFSGSVTEWSQIFGPEEPILVYSYESSSGVWDGFQKWIMNKRSLIELGWETGNASLIWQGIRGSFKAVWRFLTSEPLPGMGGRGGISTTIITTVYLVIATLVIATPLGVGAAIYLVEYAGEMGSQNPVMRRIVEVIRFAVETLAGVPSIIYGLFGFALFVTVMHLGLSLLSGALAGACLILPVIIRTTEEALLTVPRSYREGSLALGATKWQTNWQVVLPAALPGIVTGIVLGVGRIVSETAVFYVTLGGSIHLPRSIMDQGRTMVLHLYSLMMDANAPDPAMGTAIVLIFVIVLINLAINFFSTRLARSMSGRE